MLSALALENGNLSGTIPSELGRLTNLELLVLFDNKLEGTIPSELGLIADNLSKYTSAWRKWELFRCRPLIRFSDTFCQQGNCDCSAILTSRGTSQKRFAMQAFLYRTIALWSANAAQTIV
jgi:hypothetical protein